MIPGDIGDKDFRTCFLCIGKTDTHCISLVVVPYSSGLSFSGIAKYYENEFNVVVLSQSLIHQVLVSQIKFQELVDVSAQVSQSLIHQVLVSQFI